MWEIVEKQTEATQHILEALTKQLEKATKLATQNERKKIQTKNLILPKKLSEPTRYISINRFVKTYCDFIDRICEEKKADYAQYFRSFTDGPAAIWYDANIDDNMADNFPVLSVKQFVLSEKKSRK